MTISASEATVPVKHTDRFFIGGQWVTPSSDSKIDVIDSHTERVYLTVAEAQAADMDRAITAAKEAFDHGPWARLAHAERAGYLRALGEEVVKRSADIAQMWPRESGVIAAVANGAAFGAKHTFDYYADLADTFEWERPTRPQRGGFGLVVKEPVGVVGAIIPWNAPMGLISMKLAPALLAGCTVVLKTSPEAPGEGYVISEAAEAVGLPAGVLNVVTGADDVVGPVVVGDPRIRHVCFTGSVGGGKRIMTMAAANVTNVTLELGGNDPALVLHDAVLDEAAFAKMSGATFMTTGQVCMALKRLYVPRSRYNEVVDGLKATLVNQKIGPGLDPDVTMGPLNTANQRDYVAKLLEEAKAAGAEVQSCGEYAGDWTSGNYMLPSLVLNPAPELGIVAEEQFGPALPIMPYDDEEQAIRLANATWSGLCSSVWSGDTEHATQVARQLRTGVTFFNNHNATAVDERAPFGGFAQSGIGRELGREGMRDFTETHVMAVPSE